MKIVRIQKFQFTMQDIEDLANGRITLKQFAKNYGYVSQMTLKSDIMSYLELEGNEELIKKIENLNKNRIRINEEKLKNFIEKNEIIERIEKGETQAKIASELKITPKVLSDKIKKYKQIKSKSNVLNDKIMNDEENQQEI